MISRLLKALKSLQAIKKNQKNREKQEKEGKRVKEKWTGVSFNRYIDPPLEIEKKTWIGAISSMFSQIQAQLYNR